MPRLGWKAGASERETASSNENSLEARFRTAANESRESADRLGTVSEVLDAVILAGTIASEAKDKRVSFVGKGLVVGVTPLKARVDGEKDELEKSADEYDRKADEIQRSESPERVPPQSSLDRGDNPSLDHGREVDLRDILDRSDSGVGGVVLSAGALGLQRREEALDRPLSPAGRPPAQGCGRCRGRPEQTTAQSAETTLKPTFCPPPATG